MVVCVKEKLDGIAWRSDRHSLYKTYSYLRMFSQELLRVPSHGGFTHCIPRHQVLQLDLLLLLWASQGVRKRFSGIVFSAPCCISHSDHIQWLLESARDCDIEWQTNLFASAIDSLFRRATNTKHSRH